MDNLRLEHPAHPQPTPHRLLPSLDLPSPLSRSSATIRHHHHHHHFAPSWTPLLPEPPFPHHHPSSLQMPPPDCTSRPWEAAANSFLQPKLGHSIDMPPEITQCAGSSIEGLARDSSALQLKHGSSLVAAEFGHQSAPVDCTRGDTCNLLRGNAVGEFRKDDLHVQGHLGAVDSGDASPLTAVSGAHPAPFEPKADPFTVQDQKFMNFPWNDRDVDSGRPFKDSSGFSRTDGIEENSMTLIGSFSRMNYQDASRSDEKGTMVKKEQETGVTIASLEDGSIGLRLGKRTYYGDVAGGEDGSKRANSSSTGCNGSGVKNVSSKNSSNVSCATTTTTANTTTPTKATYYHSNPNPSMLTSTSAKNISGSAGNSNKKQKGSPASAVVPMCQAEGCTADLSGAKDYHRRHKVCEWHSKASKAKVNGIEQRFCQQCSRFHVLSAFDEGKRSCRRRLAGHNERRRKPPPEPLPFLSPGGFPYFADGRVNAALHEHPYFLQHRRASLLPSSIDNAVLTCQLGLAGFPQQETVGNYHALELHRFVQGLPSAGGGSGVGVLDGDGSLMLANGNALGLSSTPSLPAPASSSSVGHFPHVSSEMAISGRALSLLSPSLGSPETMSISLGMTTPSLDQMLSNTHAPTASHQQVVSKPSSCFNSGVGMSSTLHGVLQSHNHTLNSLTSSSSGCSTDIDQGEPMSNFEGRSLFLLQSESSLQALQDSRSCHNGRPVLDLMQISPELSHRHHQQHQPNVPYVDLPGLSIFNRLNIM